jgi:prepilin-type N-terminal cleavage/methylation domain-containing protein
MIQTNRRACPARPGFTLVELLVVIAIIALLIGILLPALSAVRNRAKKLSAASQLEAISRACDAYFTDFETYPGYFPSKNTYNGNYQNFSETESLVISLMGGVVSSGGDHTFQGVHIEVDEIGLGPKGTDGRRRDAFYSPKEGELVAINGTVGNDNPVPELVDPLARLPVMYFRSIPTGGAVVDTWGDNGRFARANNADYFYADALESTKDERMDQRNRSLLSGTGAGSGSNANTNMAWLVTSKALSNWSNGPNNASEDALRGAFFLMSAGKDQIYMDNKGSPGALSNESAYEDYLAESDDVVAIGGTP